MDSGALIVFAKAPVAGRVKTRLSPPLSPEAAAILYEAFLLDTLHRVIKPGIPVRLYHPPDEVMPGHLRMEGITHHTQRGPGLGERMLAAFEETLGAGHRRAVIIGTDHPTLPASLIEEALARLEDQSRIVIGPSDDGGYYLLGLTEPFPQVFAGMTYSHDAVFEQTLQRARATGNEPHILPHWYDVDTIADLYRLRTDLERDPSAAPRTAEVVAGLSIPAATVG